MAIQSWMEYIPIKKRRKKKSAGIWNDKLLMPGRSSFSKFFCEINDAFMADLATRY